MTSDAGVPGAPRFDVVLRGYDRRQVDDHVDRLQRVVSRLRADLDMARSQPMPVVRPAPQSARPRPTPRPRPGAALPEGESPDTIGTFTDRMQSILQAAEEEAAEIRRSAQKAARSETDGVRAQLADLTRQRDAVLAELTRMRSQLEGLLGAPTAAMPAHEPARPAPGRLAEGPAGPAQAGAGAVSAGPPPGRPVQEWPAGREGARPTSNGSPDPANPSDPADQSGPASAPAPRPERGRARPDAPRPTPGPKPAGTSSSSRSTSSEPSTASAADASVDGSAPDVRRDRESGKAAHRLATGAYPMVVEQSGSLRPRSEPQPEPGELFRSPPERRDEPEPRTVAVTHQPPSPQTGGSQTGHPVAPGPGDATGGDRTATVPSVPTRGDRAQARPEFGDVESTVAVGVVRPGDPTVMAPMPGAAHAEDPARAQGVDDPSGEPSSGASGARKPPQGRGTNGPNGSTRPTSTSRSG